MTDERWHWFETFCGFILGAMAMALMIFSSTQPLPQDMVCTSRNIETGECLAYVKKG